MYNKPRSLNSVGHLQLVRALQPLLGCLGNLVGPEM